MVLSLAVGHPCDGVAVAKQHEGGPPCISLAPEKIQIQNWKYGFH